MNTPSPVLSFWHRVSAWFAGLLLLSALVLIVTHYGELEHFVELLRQAEPGWLLVALLLQIATYVSVAMVWYLALRRTGLHPEFLSLIPLGIAKLFSDQAMPSGGMSGTAFFIAALNRRGVPAPLCMATLLLSLVAYYGAYLVAAGISLLVLWYDHAIHPWILAVAAVFCIVAVGIPAGALWLRGRGRQELPPLLLKIPGLGNLTNAIATASGELLRDPALIIFTSLFHGAVFVLDAATLWVMLQVVGVETSFWVAFPSFMFASMVTTVGPIPLGLGSFEVTCVSMLGLLGVPLEAALTATLLLRGFTVWLPMLPGIWLARHELR